MWVEICAVPIGRWKMVPVELYTQSLFLEKLQCNPSDVFCQGEFKKIQVIFNCSRNFIELYGISSVIASEKRLIKDKFISIIRIPKC